MARFEHVDATNGPSDSLFKTVVRCPVSLGIHEIRRKESTAPKGAHLRAPAHEVCVGRPLDFVGFLGVEGDQLNVHVTELDVGVVPVDLLNELGAVGLLRPLGGVPMLS